MKIVTVQYFASLREQRGVSSETLATTARTAAELYAELADRHGFRLAAPALRVARNGAFAPWESRLEEGDVVVFIPPVAGG